MIHNCVANQSKDNNLIKKASRNREAFYLVRLAGIEPAHPVPETGALSPEL